MSLEKSLWMIMILTVGLLIVCNKNTPTETEDQLDTPTLSSPPENATLDTATPKLQWNSVTNASAYECVVDNSSDFSSNEYSNANIQNTECTVSALNSGTYYWKIRAKDGSGNTSNWSSCTPELSGFNG